MVGTALPCRPPRLDRSLTRCKTSSMLLAKSEHLILDVLASRGPCYGLEIVQASRGRIKRGSIYVTLGRMEEKGFVTSSAGGSPRSASGRIVSVVAPITAPVVEPMPPSTIITTTSIDRTKFRF